MRHTCTINRVLITSIHYTCTINRVLNTSLRHTCTINRVLNTSLRHTCTINRVLYIKCYIDQLVYLISIIIVPRFTCPSGIQQGIFPDTIACAYFYICAGQVAFRMKCPDSLYFNSATNYCDFPYNVNCHVPVTPAVTTRAVTLGMFNYSFLIKTLIENVRF